MARDYEKLLKAIKAAGESDATPAGAAALLSKAKQEIDANEQGFPPEKIAELISAHQASVRAAAEAFVEKCV